jgi:hypothetical protein
MRRFLRDASRGLRTMPHVGPHPGVPVAVALILIGAAVGAQRGGLPTALFGALFMGLWILPLLMIGAVDRARLSDRVTQKRTVSSTG